MSTPDRRRSRRDGSTARADAPAAARRRRSLWAAAIGLVVVAAVGWTLLRGSGPWVQTTRPKNVLLITLDTTRADHLGCYGRPNAQTPNLDRLAREGTLFTRCTASSPLTLPSHSSIMTGLYPYVHGARQNGTGRLSDANLTLAEVLQTSGFATQATIASFVLNVQFGIAQGFDVYHDVVPEAAGSPLHAERKGDEVCDQALQMLDELARRPNFFLWVHFYDPHFPYESPRIADVYSPLAYADEITFMDAQIGRLLDKLRQVGREQDTLVIAVGDHGEGLGQHDELMHGYLLYDTTLHVPLILRCPNVVPAGKTVTAQVRTIDIAPTVVSLVGVPAMDEAQGVSLVPLLTGQQTDLKLAGYAESFDAHIEFGLSPLRSWSAGPWKYILAPGAELYHLADDPGETRNRFTDRPEFAAEMRSQLHQLIADAPPPRTSAETGPVLSADDRDRLASLGYVYIPVAFGQDEVELDRFEPSGGDPKDYVRFFRLLVRDLPELQGQKDWPRAELVLRQMIETMPQASRLQVQLAAVLQPQGRLDEAAAAFERALELAPDDCDIHRKFGMFLIHTQRYEEAVRRLEWVLERSPTDTVALERCAHAHVQLGQLDQAEERLRRAREIDPKSIRVLRALGAVAEKKGDLLEARKSYQTAVEVDPNCQECRRDLERVQQELWQ